MKRRTAIKTLGTAVPAMLLAKSLKAISPGKESSPASSPIAASPFKPEWQSLKQYKTPEWFRDAKFGMWAHWTAQCVPEQGDWYARQMYIQGDPANTYHVKNYGHPSKFGFMEIDNIWKADKWEPEALMKLYVNAGAKYFCALANHHDNFDNYDSTYNKWNSVNIGPKKDIVGIWAKEARKHGLRFGVTNHSAHAWHWFQSAFGYDPEGPMAGVRYDAYQLTKADGKGKWWEGLDPQELYVGKSIVLPDGFKTIKEARDWHDANDGQWLEMPPPKHPEFARSWFLRCQELVDKYKPDLLYFDDTELPLKQTGLDIAAHFYNANIKHHGRLEAVLNSKGLQPDHMGTMVLDIERGRADKILADPWQTDTCIGDWHYKRSIYDNHTYKSADTVIKMLIDIVSKNGNLLLNIPLRGNGSIDEDEHQFLTELASWIPVNGEGIYHTRPFTIFGEGQKDVSGTGNFNEDMKRPYTAQDIRFTTKGDILYAFALGWPTDGKINIKTLATGSIHYPKQVGKIELLGSKRPITFNRTADGLAITMPDEKPNKFAYTFKIWPA